MNIVAVSEDYTGRQVDVELLQTMADLRSKQVIVSNVDHVPRIVTGIEKLVQRYTMLFTSTIITVHFDSEQGNEFLLNLWGGNLSVSTGVQGAFASANTAVLNQLQGDDNDTDIYGEIPDDEAIDAATLVDFEIDYGSSTLRLEIAITTKAGDTVTFVIPTTTTE